MNFFTYTSVHHPDRAHPGSLRHFLIRNLNSEIGEALVTDVDFRPVPKRRGPQGEQQARPRVLNDDAQHIPDPFLRGLYRETEARLRKKEAVQSSRASEKGVSSRRIATCSSD